MSSLPFPSLADPHFIAAILDQTRSNASLKLRLLNALAGAATQVPKLISGALLEHIAAIAVDDENLYIRATACRILSAAQTELTPNLVEFFKSKITGENKRSFQALGVLAAVCPEQTSAIVKQLKHKAERDRSWFACRSLGMVAAARAELAADIVTFLQFNVENENPHLRKASYEALGAVAMAHVTLASPIVELLKARAEDDGDEFACRSACEALAMAAHPAQAPGVAEFLKITAEGSSRWDVQRNALLTLETMAAEHAALTSNIVEFLKGRVQRDKAWPACLALGVLATADAKQAPGLVLFLTMMKKSLDPDVCKAAADALKTIEEETKPRPQRLKRHTARILAHLEAMPENREPGLTPPSP